MVEMKLISEQNDALQQRAFFGKCYLQKAIWDICIPSEVWRMIVKRIQNLVEDIKMKNKVNSFYKGAMFIIYMALCGILSLYGSSYSGYYDYVSGSDSSAENLIEVQLDWLHKSGKYYYCEYETGLVPIRDDDGWVELHFGNGNSSYSTWEVVAAPEWIEWRQGYGTKGEGASGLTFLDQSQMTRFMAESVLLKSNLEIKPLFQQKNIHFVCPNWGLFILL